VSGKTASNLSAERPFPGLRPFAFADHEFFFARQEQSFELYRRLDRSRFLAVIGSSGSGKSSLVRAGLQPLIAAESAETLGRVWKWIELRPGDAPLASLAAALVALAPAGTDPLADAGRRERSLFMLRQSRFGVAEILDMLGPVVGGELLLLVDQFEEVFRYAKVGAAHRSNGRAATAWREEATQFVQHLLQAARDAARPVHVLVTMRSDFVGDCARFHGLPEAVSASQFLVPSLTRDQREAVIRGPLDKAGATIEPALVERILNDAGDEPDELPVLQHCLSQLWEEARRQPSVAVVASSVGAAEAEAQGNRFEPGATDSGFRESDRLEQDRAMPPPHLTLAHYAALGGVAQALSRHADEIMGSLPSDARTVEQVFRALSEVDREGTITRRPLRLAQLLAETGADEDALRRVLDRFRGEDCSFLSPPPSLVSVLAPETLVDVGHEALLRRWDKISVPPKEDLEGNRHGGGWLWQEERDGNAYRSLLGLLEGGRTLPLDQVESRWVWWNDPPRTAAWAERYGGHIDRVRQLFADSRSALDVARERQAAAHHSELAQRVAETWRLVRPIVRVAAVLGTLLLIATAILFVGPRIDFIVGEQFWQVVSISVSIAWFALLAYIVVGARDVMFTVIGRLSGFEVLGLNVAVGGGAALDAAIAKARMRRRGRVEIPERDRQRALLRAERERSLLEGAEILWVDNRPSGKRNEARMLYSFGAMITFANTTDEALEALVAAREESHSFDLIVSNMSLPPEPAPEEHAAAELVSSDGGEAEVRLEILNMKPDRGLEAASLTMLQQLGSHKIRIPVVFYIDQFRAESGTPPGAFGVTDRPDELLQLVLDALAHTRIGK
jgi:hypothetical protein